MEHSSLLQRISRILHWVGELTSRSGTAVVATVLIAIFMIFLGVNGFPGTWETTFATVVSAITLIMLFVIALTTPRADDLLVHLEVAPDDEVLEREKEQVAHHEALRDEPELEVVEYNPTRQL